MGKDRKPRLERLKVECFDPKYADPLNPHKQHQIFTNRKDAVQFKRQLITKGRAVKSFRSKKRRS